MSESIMTPDERLARLEELAEHQKRNQRRAVWAAWGSIALAAGVLGILLVSIFYLSHEANQLKTQIEASKVELQQKRAQLRSLDDELKKKEASLADVENRFAAVQQKLGTGDIADAKKLASDLPVTKITPRVFIHIRSKDQTPLAARIAEKFRTKGYSVPKAEILVDRGPARTEVRYFHQNDEERIEATALALEIGTEVRARFIPGFESSPLVKPRQFEVWLAPGS